MDGWACWKGSTVAVVILGLFLFVFELGDCGLMGVGRFFFFFKLLPQLFQAANV